jgi:bifunctional enzyme Fae/Hps
MLDKRKKYLQVAFNRPLEEIAAMIFSLPLSDRIIIEAGYPLIKNYGTDAIRTIKSLWEQRVFSIFSTSTQDVQIPLAGLTPFFLKKILEDQKKQKARRRFINNKNQIITPYIIADLKCMDRAFTEVEAAASAGASAATCLGLAPLETVNEFVRHCEKIGIDSVLDMINIEYPFEILSKLDNLPKIVMIHRGVDEGEENKEKEVPYDQIARIKSVYDDVLIAVAGGETINEVMEGSFNDADIVIVWRPLNENPKMVGALANEFLKEIK